MSLNHVFRIIFSNHHINNYVSLYRRTLIFAGTSWNALQHLAQVRMLPSTNGAIAKEVPRKSPRMSLNRLEEIRRLPRISEIPKELYGWSQEPTKLPEKIDKDLIIYPINHFTVSQR